MSYQEKQTLSYLISSLIVIGVYAFFVFHQYQEGSFESTTISSRWGTIILILIGAQIILSIISSILVSIIHTVITKENSSVSDERDLMINLKANQISYSVFGIGFMAAMITLAIGLPPLVMFNLIVFSIFGAGIIGYITQLYLYRRGF